MNIRDLEIKLDALDYQGFKKGDECYDYYLKKWKSAKEKCNARQQAIGRKNTVQAQGWYGQSVPA